MFLNRFTRYMPYTRLFSGSKSLPKAKTKESIIGDSSSQDVLNRVKVVTDVSESKKIINKLVDSGQPIGVDMEGVHTSPVSMVQVCDIKRDITLFRTGVNPALYWEGG